MNRSKFRIVTPLLLCAGLLAATGCAHDRHTGAVIGGIVGAGIGYVIASEHEHHGQHHRPKDKHYSSRDHGYPAPAHRKPSRDPYCR